MYTIEQGMANVLADPTAVVIMAFITYGFGFLQYGASMWMQVKNKQCPFYFWMHAWYFGHDVTFAFICFNQWFFQIRFWLFEVLAVGCMAFVGIEIFSLYQCVKNERQEVFGRFTNGKPVSKRYAWTRGLIGYGIGVLLFQTLRFTIGDPLCLFLMMSTNAILALMVQRRYDEIGHYQPGMKFLAVFTLLGTIFTFAPQGIGFFATIVPTLQGNVLWEIVGLVCLACCVKAVYSAWTLKPLPAHAAVEDAPASVASAAVATAGSARIEG
jgi:hypothetical protein